MQGLYFDPDQTPNLKVLEIEKPTVAPHHVLIRVKAAALNRRDEWIRQGKYPGLKASILGSDCCGVIEEIGSGVHERWLNERVVVNPNNNWGDKEAYQSQEYHILGMPNNGSFAEFLCVHEDRLALAPPFLNNQEAAALPLAGLTAYRACFTQARIYAGQKVLITGFGGGVAQFAVQFALAKGARVAVTSGSEEKLALAKEMGVEWAFNYKDEDWDKAIAKTVGPLNACIDSAGGEGFSKILKLLGRAGALVFYGATTGLPPKIDLYRMFFNQIRIQGSTMGSDHEFLEMLHFVEKHEIHPVISSEYSLKEGIEAFNEMRDNQNFGKIILKIS